MAQIMRRFRLPPGPGWFSRVNNVLAFRDLNEAILGMEVIKWTNVLEKPTAFQPTEHSQDMSTINGLNAALALKAPLEGGVVPLNYMHPQLKRQRFEANTQGVMLSLPAFIGDFCSRTDAGESGNIYQLTQAPATALENWALVKSPGTTTVSSVNGKSGVVTLTVTDVGAAPFAHVGDFSNPHRVTKQQVGLGNVSNVEQIPITQKGQPGGVAALDANGFVKPEHLPTTEAQAFARVVYETPLQNLAPGQTVDHLLSMNVNRFTGLQVTALGMQMGHADKLEVTLYGSGTLGSWADGMYQAEFGFYDPQTYLTTSSEQGWMYRDLAGLKVLRVRLKNTGEQPISQGGVSIVAEELP